MSYYNDYLPRIDSYGNRQFFERGIFVSREGKSIIEQSIVGGVQGKLPIYNIEKLELLIPNGIAIKQFDYAIGIIDNEARIKQIESSKLKELQSLLLAKTFHY